jgi:hypothetical protein
MPYYTGTANSAADLITAIKNAATANSWALTGGVLSKGDIFATLHEGDTQLTDHGVYVEVSSGSPAGNLCPNRVGMTTYILQSGRGVPLQYPCTYHIFINTGPDDIVVLVNYSSIYWQQLAFGQADVMGAAGSGVYCWGTARWNQNLPGLLFQHAAGGGETGWCFYTKSNSVTAANSFIYLNSQSIGWWGNKAYPGGTGSPGTLQAFYSADPILKYQPNAWNNEAILIRVQLMAHRPSYYYSYAAQLPHIRYINNKWIEDNTILALGSDNWFIAAAFRRSVGNQERYSSGEFAFAIRKTA